MQGSQANDEAAAARSAARVKSAAQERASRMVMGAVAEAAGMAARQAVAKSYWSTLKQHAQSGHISAGELARRKPRMLMATCVAAFAAEEPLELSCVEGERLRVLHDVDHVASPAGWLMAINAEGAEGLVPASFMRLESPAPRAAHLGGDLGAAADATALGDLGDAPVAGADVTGDRLDDELALLDNWDLAVQRMHWRRGRGVSTPVEERDASIADMAAFDLQPELSEAGIDDDQRAGGSHRDDGLDGGPGGTDDRDNLRDDGSGREAVASKAAARVVAVTAAVTTAMLAAERVDAAESEAAAASEQTAAANKAADDASKEPDGEALERAAPAAVALAPPASLSMAAILLAKRHARRLRERFVDPLGDGIDEDGNRRLLGRGGSRDAPPSMMRHRSESRKLPAGHGHGQGQSSRKKVLAQPTAELTAEHAARREAAVAKLQARTRGRLARKAQPQRTAAARAMAAAAVGEERGREDRSEAAARVYDVQRRDAMSAIERALRFSREAEEPEEEVEKVEEEVEEEEVEVVEEEVEEPEEEVEEPGEEPGRGTSDEAQAESQAESGHASQSYSSAHSGGSGSSRWRSSSLRATRPLATRTCHSSERAVAGRCAASCMVQAALASAAASCGEAGE